jgi:hypothetical protein
MFRATNHPSSGAWQRPPTTPPTTFHVWRTRDCQCSFRLLMMGGVSPVTCWTLYKYRIIKFWYIVASFWIFLYELYCDARIHQHQAIATHSNHLRPVVVRCQNGYKYSHLSPSIIIPDLNPWPICAAFQRPLLSRIITRIIDKDGVTDDHYGHSRHIRWVPAKQILLTNVQISVL